MLLGALIALLAGLAIGKAWERYKLQDGRWVDRRRARDSPHYMLGLNFLVANQIDPAIEELVKAAHGAGDPLKLIGPGQAVGLSHAREFGAELCDVALLQAIIEK